MGLVCPRCDLRPRVLQQGGGGWAAVGRIPGGGAGLTPQPWLTPRPLCSAFQNMPNVRDHDASVYLRLQGDALSVGGYEANPIFWEEVRPDGKEEGVWGCVSARRSLLPGGPPPAAPRVDV